MATGRTLKRWSRVYADGYDLSGYAREIGPLSIEHDEADLTTIADGVKGVLPNHARIDIGELKGVMDNTETSGLHIVASGAGVARDVMVAQGIRAAPAQGDPAFCGKFMQLGYKQEEDSGAILVSLPFGAWDVADMINYRKAWGVLLHANSAATAANSAAGVDTLAATTAGGYMMYQVFAASGAGHTATLSVDDSANNSDFLALSDATTGEIDVGTAPVAGIIQIGTTATVRQYLRWQIALGTATSVTFAMAFVKG
jgi:hypothetical protein